MKLLINNIGEAKMTEKELISRPRLLRWQFDDEVESNDPSEWNWVEITMNFTDGSRRWSILYTPERLHNNLTRLNIDPPGLHMSQLIVVRSYEINDIDRVLRVFDEDDTLIKASRAYPE
ncbi:hypothetical protein DNH61_03650 [Paenibacillus sambharensis]|uniref:Uncharacterized protein n=1 Tax=Paenibacillus sambharensis TaxID=1803190 RepID=A0A2W1LEK3_9BACL|nr:hypothetical protein [Paenibacillus sambharensis]PZD97243.1 hypothetical protein DNH61_03650 [Paenibacillus sambharensis]